MLFSDTSQQSPPSLSSSVITAKSSPLHSPKGSDLFIENRRFKPKFSPSNLNGELRVRQPSSIRRMSTSESDTLARPRRSSVGPSSPSRRVSDTQDISPESFHDSDRKRRYQPYVPRSGYVLPGLLYAARSFGMMSPTDLTVDEVEENKDMFVQVLSSMPDRVLLSALDLKRADYDRIALRLALTTAEIKFTEQRQNFLSTMRDQHDGDLAVSGACLDVLDQVLALRSLSEPDGNTEFHRNAHTEALAELSITESHVSHLQDLIGPQGARWLEDEDEVDKVFPEEDEEEPAVEH